MFPHRCSFLFSQAVQCKCMNSEKNGLGGWGDGGWGWGAGGMKARDDRERE